MKYFFVVIAEDEPHYGGTTAKLEIKIYETEKLREKHHGMSGLKFDMTLEEFRRLNWDFNPYPYGSKEFQDMFWKHWRKLELER